MKVPVLKSEHDSFWHRRDPRTKVGLFIALVLLIYLAPSWVWMAGLVALGALLAWSARAPLGWLAVMLAIQIPNVIGLVLLPAWAGIASGEFAVDAEFAFGLRMALGWIAAVLIGVSLVSTMEIDEITEGLRGVGLPRRFAFSVGYAFMLAYLSVSDILRIYEAARLKGVELSLRHPIAFVRGVFSLLMPVFFTTARRGGAMMAALDMRGFSDRTAPVRRTRRRFDLRDAGALASGMLLVVYAGAIRADIVEPFHPWLGTQAVKAEPQ